MNALMRESSRTRQALELREIDNTRWQVMVTVGEGRLLEFESEDMRLELFLPPWSTQPRRTGPRSMFDTAVRSRVGELLSDGAGALWCLMGGVPLPGASASADERELRLSIALARAPKALTDVLGPLALLPGGSGDGNAASDGNATRLVDPEALLGSAAVEMMLRLTRQDVTVYARASASPELWLTLLEAMTPSSPPAPLRRAVTPVDEARVVAVAVGVATGSLSVDAIRTLAVGDVVRLPTTLGVNGVGTLQVADVDIGVLWRARVPQHVFEVTSVTRRSLSSTRSSVREAAISSGAPRPSKESDPMNVDHEVQSDEEGPANSLLDEEPSDDTGDEQGSGGWSESGPSTLDGLAISVVAEIGTLTMSLGNLRTLKPGTLIKLGARGHGEVVLRAIDGPPIAYAELVDIGGHLGLQVTRVANA